MPEDVQPVAEEVTPVESSATSEEVSEENRIPHSRVKEMTEREYQRGREEALRELLKDNDDKQVPQSEPKGEPSEREEAMKVLREAVRAEIGPYLSKQEIKEFLDSTPDADKYVKEIKELRVKNPSLDWKSAYKLASFDDKLKEASQKGIEEGFKGVAERKSAITEKPVATTSAREKTPLEQLAAGEITSAQFADTIRKRHNN